LKPANILLDFAGQPLLADFAYAHEFSPYSASPARRAGAKASVGDDIRAFGATIFELLTGYPPHFPNRPDESEAVLKRIPVTETLPESFERLVLAMLSPREHLRPQSMQEIAAVLAALITRGALRPAVEMPSASAGSRGPSKRWTPLVFAAAGLAVLWVVFVILPTVAPEATPDRFRTQTTAVPALDLAAIEKRRQQRNEYEEWRERYELLLEGLEAQAAGVWGGEIFAAAKQLADQADGAADSNDYALALERIETAARRLERVVTQRPAVLAERLRIGTTAIEAGQLDVARQSFELARQMDPGNAAAEQGLVRVLALGPVLGDLVAGETARLAKEFLRALTLYETVLRADPGNTAAASGLREVRTAISTDSYAREIGSALAELRAGRLETARAALSRAAALRPAAPEIAAVSRQVQAANRRFELQGSASEIEQLEQTERWAEALAAYDELLKQDAGLAFARDGRARVAPRAELAARLQGLIDRSGRLTAPEVRREAERLLAQAKSQLDAPVLRQQERQLREALQRYERTIVAVIQSDGFTEVRVQRVGAFGVFERKEIALKPGRYVVIGSRVGFRDVRREVVIDPDSEPPTIEVRCTERLS
jgi:hypothetical protein